MLSDWAQKEAEHEARRELLAAQAEELAALRTVPIPPHQPNQTQPNPIRPDPTLPNPPTQPSTLRRGAKAPTRAHRADVSEPRPNDSRRLLQLPIQLSIPILGAVSALVYSLLLGLSSECSPLCLPSVFVHPTFAHQTNKDTTSFAFLPRRSWRPSGRRPPSPAPLPRPTPPTAQGADPSSPSPPPLTIADRLSKTVCYAAPCFCHEFLRLKLILFLQLLNGCRCPCLYRNYGSCPTIRGEGRHSILLGYFN